MERILLFSTGLALFLMSCGNGADDADSEDTTTTSTMNTDTTTVTTSTGMTDTMPFKGVMDKMMRDMHGMTMTGDVDQDFAMMMRHHHQGAIEMSNVEQSRGQDTTLKALAQKIIDDSQKDIGELDSFVNSRQQPKGTSDFSKKAMDRMMKGHSDSTMIQMHAGSVDQQFARMMHMHHKQGIDMSREYLKSAKAPATRKVANDVIKTNTEDNRRLKTWMDKHQSDTTAHHSGM